MARARGIPLKAVGIFLLAAAIGVAGGLLGAGFQNALSWIQHLLIGTGDSLSDAVRTHLSPLQTVLVPTVGGVLAGGLLLLLGRQKPPFGINDIIGLVALRRGTIRLRHSIVQILSSACTIGTGGSIGREGANSQIAATIASLLGRAFRVTSRTRSVLLGCGVAAGMATSYNAPIAGAIFVMEAVLGNFAMDVFAPIVVSSVLATMLRKALLSEHPTYGAGLPDLQLSWELVLAALLLGCICGVGALLFRHSLKFGRRLFAAMSLPRPLALGLGGLCVGVLGLWLPETWGNGVEVVHKLTSAVQLPAVGIVFALFFWKMFATVATVGSGGLGGVFTPNLVVGAAFGSFFASALHWLQGSGGDVSNTEQITFAFVGMAGLCAATTHAPITAVVLVFELTGHYELVLPIMLCSITASIVASMIDQDSYYTESIRAKGGELPGTLEELAIRTTYVRDVMRRDVPTVPHTASFDKVMDFLANHRSDTLYVVGDDGQLVGSIQLHDVKNFINDPTLSSVVIAGDLTRPVAAVTPDDSLAAGMGRFDDRDVAELAVVSPGGTRRLLGRITRQDVLTGIGEEVLGQQRRARFRSADGRKIALELPAGFVMSTVPVPEEWYGLSLDGIPAADLAGVTPVLVLQKGPDGAEARLPAAPERVLEPGMELVVIASAEALQRWREGDRPEV